MKKLTLFCIALFAVSAFGQSVDVITSSLTVETRTYLKSVSPSYSIEGGTNMTCNAVTFISVTERKVGNGSWEKVGEEHRLVTKAMATAWPDSYTNAANTVVTNGIKAAVLADFTRLDLFPPRWRSITLNPGAVTIPPQE